MVILSVSDRVNFLGLTVLREGGEEEGEGLRRRREAFWVRKRGVWEDTGAGFRGEVTAGSGRGARSGGG